jgi:transposase-like protein
VEFDDALPVEVSEGLFAFPKNVRRRLRTSRMCEILNSQIERRTKVAGIFLHEAFILPFVSAILMDYGLEVRKAAPLDHCRRHRLML